ncbi:hypothetical protein Cgig2_005236 [Carnegiea gigantea]|uniref:Acyl-CoA oxidase C-terminal domain-containing protein n=1 Tax=Carnegiea gigantea TaxID=171969 RepID=A0A9Q1K466_9CARY|nr:hypothetical protein Cgig2_005236 [Carnegiea gigantea]
MKNIRSKISPTVGTDKNCAFDVNSYERHCANGYSKFSTDRVRAALAHCQPTVVSEFIEKLHQGMPAGVKQQLRVLCSMCALNTLKKHLGDFLATGCISASHLSKLHLPMISLDVCSLRFASIQFALVDAFNYTDHSLGSLYEEAWKDPLNESVMPEGYHEYIRPMLEQQVLRSRLRL